MDMKCDNCGVPDSTVDMRTFEYHGVLAIGMLCDTCAALPGGGLIMPKGEEIIAVANNQAITKGVRIA